MNIQSAVFIAFTLAAFGCAGPNPNPGERSVDVAWHEGNYPRVHELLRPAAERGEPWAQLRMGVAYEVGVGITKNTAEALQWYRKAAVQTGEGGWAEGLMVGAVGKLGYFNQNSDALIAQHQISKIYLRGDSVEKDLVEAYLWAKNVSDKTQGKGLFYCCEFAGGRYFPAEDFAATLKEIESGMTDEQKNIAAQRSANWRPD